MALSDADKGADGGMVPWSTDFILIPDPFETILALDSKFKPPLFEGAAWHPDNAQLLVTNDLTAKNLGPGVPPDGFGSGLVSSLFEQENVIPVAIAMLRIKISFLIEVCLE